MELTTSWKELGRILQFRECIEIVWEARFGTAPLEVAAAINKMSDVPRLKEWHRLAGTVRSLPEFAGSIATQT